MIASRWRQVIWRDASSILDLTSSTGRRLRRGLMACLFLWFSETIRWKDHHNDGVGYRSVNLFRVAWWSYTSQGLWDLLVCLALCVPHPWKLGISLPGLFVVFNACLLLSLQTLKFRVWLRIKHYSLEVTSQIRKCTLGVEAVGTWVTLQYSSNQQHCMEISLDLVFWFSWYVLVSLYRWSI